MAESDRVFRHGEADHTDRRKWRENERAVRICRAFLLGSGSSSSYGRKVMQRRRMWWRLRLQQRNQHGTSGSADRERAAHGSQGSSLDGGWAVGSALEFPRGRRVLQNDTSVYRRPERALWKGRQRGRLHLQITA